MPIPITNGELIQLDEGSFASSFIINGYVNATPNNSSIPTRNERQEYL